MHVLHYYAGLMIELSNGTRYDSNVAISIGIAGEADSEAVLCRTDLTTCCTGSSSGSGQGDWIYPNGTEVRNRPSGDGIFRTRGDMIVRLHRMGNVVAPTGQYCCEVATMDNPNARICITLSKLKTPEGNRQGCCSSINSLTFTDCGGNNCATDATCTSTAGSFTCDCKQGYSGNGLTCMGK